MVRKVQRRVASQDALNYSVEGWVCETVPVDARRVTGPDDVAAECAALKRSRREIFGVLLLNARHEIMQRVTVSIGSLNASIVHPREVFAPAIVHSAAAVILIHNHPSGDPSLSEEDLAITKRLVDAGEMLGIKVLDHVIVASRGIVSLRQRGVIA